MTAYNTECTHEATCPHCGYADKDSWELDSENNSGETDCPSCGKPYFWERNVRITFSTEKIRGREDDDGELGEEDVEDDGESGS